MRIHVDPTPPVQGSQIEVSFDFSGGLNPPVKLEVEWTPGGSAEYELDDPPGSITIDVPADATAVRISDLTYMSEDYTSPVAKPAEA